MSEHGTRGAQVHPQSTADSNNGQQNSGIAKLQETVLNMVKNKAEKYKGEDSTDFATLKRKLRDLAKQNVFIESQIGGQEGNFRFMTSSRDFMTIVAVPNSQKKTLDRQTIFVWDRYGRDFSSGYELNQAFTEFEEVAANDDQDDDSSSEVEIVEYPDLIDKILCIAISKDSLILVYGHNNEGLQIWARSGRFNTSLDTFQQRKTFQEFKSAKIIPQRKKVTPVVLSEDKKTLVAGMSDGNVVIFEINHQGDKVLIEGEPTKLEPKLKTAVKHLALSADSRTLVAVGSSEDSQAGALVAWSLYENGGYSFRKKIEDCIETHVHSLFLNKDQDMVCYNSSTDVFIWDLKDGDPPYKIIPGNNSLNNMKNVRISSDFKTLFIERSNFIDVYCSKDQWKIKIKVEIKEEKKPENEGTEDKQNEKKKVRRIIWKMGTRRRTRRRMRRKMRRNMRRRMRRSIGKKNEKKYTKKANIKDKEVIEYRIAQKLPLSQAKSNSLILSPDGNRLIVFASDGNSVVWSRPAAIPETDPKISIQKLSRMTETPDEKIKVLSLSDDQLTLVALFQEGSLVVYNREKKEVNFGEGKRLQNLTLEGNPRVVMSKDSKTLLCEIIKVDVERRQIKKIEKLFEIYTRNN